MANRCARAQASVMNVWCAEDAFGLSLQTACCAGNGTGVVLRGDGTHQALLVFEAWCVRGRISGGLQRG